jgi:hypothetical protein
MLVKAADAHDLIFSWTPFRQDDSVLSAVVEAQGPAGRQIQLDFALGAVGLHSQNHTSKAEYAFGTGETITCGPSASVCEFTELCSLTLLTAPPLQAKR